MYDLLFERLLCERERDLEREYLLCERLLDRDRDFDLDRERDSDLFEAFDPLRERDRLSDFARAALSVGDLVRERDALASTFFPSASLMTAASVGDEECAGARSLLLLHDLSLSVPAAK